MDFNDTPEEAAYRKQVRAWLDKNATRKTDAKGMELPRDLKELIAQSKAWQAKKADAGYACITWPKEWGGGGGTTIQNVIYGQEEANYLVPGGIFAIGLGMCIPTVMAWGPEEAKKRFVGPAVRGDEIWCQLFPSPQAARTWRAFEPKRRRMAMSGSSTARRSGRRAPISATTASC